MSKGHWVVRFALVVVFAGAGCKTEAPAAKPEPPEVKPESPEKKRGADMVLRGGRIATVDEAFTIHSAMAIEGDRIAWVGSDEGAEAYIGDNTRVIDLDGKLVLPGLADAHAHIYGLGQKLTNLDLPRGAQFEEIVGLVQRHVKIKTPGEWVIGGRWDQTVWPGKSFPNHAELSAVSPRNPVYLSRVDGNSALVNRAAMKLAGIDDDTPDPEGGKIIRDETGAPTGVLINRAMNLVKHLFPKKSETEYQESVVKALDHCTQLGLTSIHEAGINPWEIGNYKALIDADRIHVRVYAMLGDQEHPIIEAEDLAGYLEKHRLEDYGDHRLAVKSVKLFCDGALGSRGAAFFEPYNDDPKNRGLLRITPEYITKISRAALEVGMGVATHNIGIRGNRVCLEAYEEALKEFPERDHRFRMEHAQVVRDEDIALFKKLGVIPSMQPVHCTSDMGFVEDRVGKERAKGAYAWRSFRDAGLTLPMGSDFPVESPNPLHGIYAAVTRQDHSGKPDGGWYPKQRLTIEEAIRGFTIWAAHAAFLEDHIGSLEKGKLADFVILDKNILEIPPKEILEAKVLLTVIGGTVRYQATGV